MPEYSTLDPKKLIYVAGVEALKEYNEGKRVRVSNSKVKLTVSPFLPPGIPVEILGADISGLITEVNWQKSLSSPSGNFTVTMVNDKVKIKKIGLGYPLSTIWDKFGASLLDVFKMQTIAKLDIAGYHIMTGYVESINKFSSGDGTEYVTVEFNELGELYNRSISSPFQNGLDIDPKDLFIVGDPDKLTNSSITLTGMSLEIALLTLLKGFLGNTLNYGVKGFPPYYKWSDGATLPFRFITAPAPLGGISTQSFIKNVASDFSLNASSYNQSFWDWIKKLLPEPWMECFTESGGRTINTGRITNIGGERSDFGSLFSDGISQGAIPRFNITPMLPGFSYLIVRSTPYDNPYTGYNPFQYSNYNFGNGVLDLIVSGDFIMISDYDVVSKQLGQSQENQYTGFKVNVSKGNGLNSISGFGRPIFSRGSILPIMPGGQRSYGNRYMIKEIDITSSNPGGFVNQLINSKDAPNPINPTFNVQVASSYLQAWYRNAGKFREGSITTRMIPYARPGMMLIYTDPKNGKSDDQRENGMYYIDSMAGNWKYGESDSTQFSVIRGTPFPFDATSLSLLLLDWELTSESGLFDL